MSGPVKHATPILTLLLLTAALLALIQFGGELVQLVGLLALFLVAGVLIVLLVMLIARI